MITSLDNRPKFTETNFVSSELLRVPSHAEAEQQLTQLLNLDNLDQQINQHPELSEQFEASLTEALNLAYTLGLRTTVLAYSCIAFSIGLIV